MGITGVPRYRTGLRNGNGSPAATTPGAISVVGDANGDGAADKDGLLGPAASYRTNSLGLATGTPIVVRLKESVSSGTARNGQMLDASLVNEVGGVAAGSPVQLTVVAVAAAGQMTSQGELSVQVVSINGNAVLSQVVTAEGKAGDRLTPDATAARGTEALLTPGTPLTLPAA